MARADHFLTDGIEGNYLIMQLPISKFSVLFMQLQISYNDNYIFMRSQFLEFPELILYKYSVGGVCELRQGAQSSCLSLIRFCQ